MMTLDLDDPSAAAAKLNAFSEAGATRVVHAWRYADTKEFMRAIDTLATQVRPQIGGETTSAFRSNPSGRTSAPSLMASISPKR